MTKNILFITLTIFLINQTNSEQWYETGNPHFLDTNTVFPAVKQQNTIKIIKFFSPWCKYCRYIKAYVDQYKQKNQISSNLKFYQFNCHSNGAMFCFEHFAVRAYPAVVVINQNGDKVSRIDGLYPQQVINNILNQFNGKAKAILQNLKKQDSQKLEKKQDKKQQVKQESNQQNKQEIENKKEDNKQSKKMNQNGQQKKQENQQKQKKQKQQPPKVNNQQQNKPKQKQQQKKQQKKETRQPQKQIKEPQKQTKVVQKQQNKKQQKKEPQKQQKRKQQVVVVLPKQLQQNTQEQQQQQEESQQQQQQQQQKPKPIKIQRQMVSQTNIQDISKPHPNKPQLQQKPFASKEEKQQSSSFIKYFLYLTGISVVVLYGMKIFTSKHEHSPRKQKIKQRYEDKPESKATVAVKSGNKLTARDIENQILIQQISDENL